ncbi:endo alpha-1,4 polygalactosaminidase [Mesorhizobium comanense]|uniref:endo alpha-1,4 polygalactosaminidase n=1 Tax=Mesorhizobium comanense TaxID=2502215 RepID=UPI0010F6DBC3|nr:endo alpha-1,4 polygalactosaminidase [Mesorhizobium comanense]
MRRLNLALALAIFWPAPLAVAGETAADPGKQASPNGLPANAVADYQLGGAYEPPAGVNVVVRDSSAAPASGLYSICYVNGFQTQPATQWPADLLVADRAGQPLADPDWPDEYLLNISSQKLRQRILGRLTETISRCARAGFNAAEFDNLDSYTRSKGALKKADALALALLLVRTAHESGLAAGQKNTPQLTEKDRQGIGFDFAIAEECHRYDECKAYTRFYGNKVIDIEYTDNLRGSFSDVCADPTIPRNTILRDRKLSPATHRQYHFEHC